MLGRLAHFPLSSNLLLPLPCREHLCEQQAELDYLCGRHTDTQRGSRLVSGRDEDGFWLTAAQRWSVVSTQRPVVSMVSFPHHGSGRSCQTGDCRGIYVSMVPISRFALQTDLLFRQVGISLPQALPLPLPQTEPVCCGVQGEFSVDTVVPYEPRLSLGRLRAQSINSTMTGCLVKLDLQTSNNLFFFLSLSKPVTL